MIYTDSHGAHDSSTSSRVLTQNYATMQIIKALLAMDKLITHNVSKSSFEAWSVKSNNAGF